MTLTLGKWATVVPTARIEEALDRVRDLARIPGITPERSFALAQAAGIIDSEVHDESKRQEELAEAIKAEMDSSPLLSMPATPAPRFDVEVTVQYDDRATVTEWFNITQAEVTTLEEDFVDILRHLIAHGAEDYEPATGEFHVYEAGTMKRVQSVRSTGRE